MIVWINGAFGSGKTSVAYELNRRIKESFVFDPENIGFYIRKNIPNVMLEDDFQDFKSWRRFNFKMLEDISNNYDGIIIVPMTITNVKYFNEIIVKLKNNGIVVNHYTLYASKEVLLRRLNKRLDGKNSWPAKQIDRCIKAFNNKIFEKYVYTDNISVDEVADKIGELSGIKFEKDRLGKIEKLWFKVKLSLKHIRF